MEKIAKPIAVMMALPCLSMDRTLKPESPCAHRRDKMNQVGKRILDTAQSVKEKVFP